MYFCYLVIISPWKKDVAFPLKILEYPSPKDMISLVEIGRVVLEKKIFKFHQCVFAFSNYLPLDKGMALNIITNLNSLHPRMLCAKFGWNWLSAS